MAKNSIRDFSATAASNTDIQSVDIDENCAASGINNAIRELMADLADVNAGTVAMTSPSADSLSTDTISEKTSGSGVTIDSVLLKDGALGSIASAVAAHLTSINGGQIGGNRNLIINGAFEVAQRATSKAHTESAINGYYTVDRFQLLSNAMDQLRVTQTQSTTSPDGFSNSFGVEVTVAESALAADEILYIQYRAEAQDLQHLAYGTSDAKKVTLSFYVRSSLTGKYTVLLYQDDATRSNTQSITINSANTWERKTITFDGDTSGTINNDNGYGLLMNVVLAAGTDFAGTPHTGWGTYNQTDDFAHGDQVNFAAQTGTFFITGIQLEVGSTATEFEHRSYGDELRRCQRYYYKLKPGSTASGYASCNSNNTSRSDAICHFPVTMRSIPTAVETTGVASDYGSLTAGVNVNCNSVPTFVRASLNTSFVRFPYASGSVTTGQAGVIQAKHADSFLAWSAEL
tara:strand:- start:15314 stop:16693 length:1380 start_codon:yes stop_codon:yes gene_type:complete